MAIFRHEVTLAGCSREWFEQFVAEARSEAEAAGAAKGARYQIGPPGEGAAVTVTGWDPAGATRLVLLTQGDETTTEIMLRSAVRPQAIEAKGWYQDDDGPWYARRLDWTATVSLTRWWDRLGNGKAKGAGPATATLVHPLVKAEATASPRRAGSAGGQPEWTVEVVTAVRGRRWARPLVAPVLLLLRRRLQDAYREQLTAMAAGASTAITALTSKSPREAVDAAALIASDSTDAGA